MAKKETEAPAPAPLTETGGLEPQPEAETGLKADVPEADPLDKLTDVLQLTQALELVKGVQARNLDLARQAEKGTWATLARSRAENSHLRQAIESLDVLVRA